MIWKDAVIDSITSLTISLSRNNFTRQELIDFRLNEIIAAVGSTGATPKQTLSRILQELRNEGFLEFLGNGEYRLLNSSYTPVSIDLPEDLTTVPARVPTTISRILRDPAIVAALKRKYSFRCQLCSIRLELKSGFYCEAHHICPLGKPHNGPDSESNLIIVCPNHHVLLDYAAIRLMRTDLRMTLHHIDDRHLDYHNTRLYRSV